MSLVVLKLIESSSPGSREISHQIYAFLLAQNVTFKLTALL